MSNEFAHLHLHTDYSLLDGACSVKRVMEKIQEHGMKAVACTDHGNMGATVDFYKTMKSNGIKPIIGCEFYVAPKSLHDRDANQKYKNGFHLVLLAKDYVGYQNLCRLNSVAWLEGHYYKPRIDKELLAKHSKGLIGSSACIGGEIPVAILGKIKQTPQEVLREYTDIIGEENFYLEIQDHGIPEQKIVNKGLIKLSKEFGIPLIATNDSHYANKEDAPAHDALLCIGTQKLLSDEKRMRFPTDEFYIKSTEEMQQLFKEVPSAITNTMEIVERCNLELKIGKAMENHYPVYEVPDKNVSREDLLKNICIKAMKQRYDIDYNEANLSDEQKVYTERLDYELRVIKKMGFISYFLVVWDFLRYAREDKGIPIGPGRGSGAGSIVAYLTHITNIDPIKYGLIFERFLNPDRVSPPDFDIDICERRRNEVIKYVRDKYGKDSVAQIGTYGTLKTKAVLKDVARVMGKSFQESNMITGLIPEGAKNLKEALSESSKLNNLKENEEWVGKLFRLSFVLEGINRNKSIHAAGVIIGDQPLSNLVPLSKGSGNEAVTQFPGPPCEELGLLKMDFLGLRTLTVIQDTLDIIKHTRNIKLESWDIPLGDKNTFALINHGDTVGTFQIESRGMRDLCRRFGVSTLEHIIALIALYRPGAMQFIDDFVKRKMGKEKVEYDVPAMEGILKETYGIMLYQEQIMQVVQIVAGFTFGKADILRRAMGKKKEKLLLSQHKDFIKGAKENGYDEKISEEIWEKIKMFAGYGFNKSHSAAYAMLAYRTAYLKANYSAEFMAAVLSSEINNPDKLSALIAECSEMNIEVLPPNVNASLGNFTVDGSAIRFGLEGIKGVGAAAAEKIISTRNKDGKFKSLLDYAERTIPKTNKRVMESLCRTGAFDCFNLKRSQVFEMIESVLSTAQSTAKDKAAGQGNLFDFAAEHSDKDIQFEAVPVPNIPEWAQRELLAGEKELLGFYVTGHPLGEYHNIIRTYDLVSIPEINEKQNETGTRFGGVITSVSQKVSKKRQPWAILSVEDLNGSIECLMFPKCYEEYSKNIEEDKVIFLEAFVKKEDGGGTQLIAEKLIPIEQVPALYTEELHIRINEASCSEEDLMRLKKLLDENPGETPVIICIICNGGEMAFVKNGKKCMVSLELIHKIKKIFGEESVHIRPDKTLPKKKPRYQKNNYNNGD